MQQTPDQSPLAPAPAQPVPDPKSPGDISSVRIPRLARNRRRSVRHFLLLLGPLIVVVAGGYMYFTGGRYVSTDNAYVKADKVLVAAEVSGLITKVAVQENQHVALGDLLFRIDDGPYRIALAQAEARLAGTRDELASLKATCRAKVQEHTLGHIIVAFNRKEFERQSKLVGTHVISKSKFDATEYDLAAASQCVLMTEQEMAHTSVANWAETPKRR